MSSRASLRGILGHAAFPRLRAHAPRRALRAGASEDQRPAVRRRGGVQEGARDCRSAGATGRHPAIPDRLSGFPQCANDDRARLRHGGKGGRLEPRARRGVRRGVRQAAGQSLADGPQRGRHGYRRVPLRRESLAAGGGAVRAPGGEGAESGRPAGARNTADWRRRRGLRWGAYWRNRAATRRRARRCKNRSRRPARRTPPALSPNSPPRRATSTPCSTRSERRF